jgi:glucans biosynthesis protein
MYIRTLVAVVLAASFTSVIALADDRPATPFDRNRLIAEAEALSRLPFVEPRLPAGTSAEALTYDQYRAIEFRSGAAIWARENRGFSIDLFHPGFIYRTPVEINLVVAGRARPVLFTNEIFKYGLNVPTAEAAPGLGYSGFRVRAPINRPDRVEEFLVFQGASYFRAVGRGQFYGLSARGLAVRTARPSGEEFPLFTKFWIERPPEQAHRIVIHALLESRSVVGAYSFSVEPGEETVMDVEAVLFPRVEIDAYGIAPLTSMFLFDASNPGRFDDFRRAVHDSDGLLMHSGSGERIWRPLANPRSLQVSAFMDRDPRGFGLLQRKRTFEEFEDYQARYERRPSLWVEPRGNWGEGHVELVEIPTDQEIHDNIVAYWQPAASIGASQRIDLAYRLRWLAEPLDDSLARVVATRSGQSLQSEHRLFVVDFEASGSVPEDLELDVTSSAGTVQNARAELVEPSGLYRVSFELDPKRAASAELRLTLTKAERPWSETWLYRWNR